MYFIILFFILQKLNNYKRIENILDKIENILAVEINEKTIFKLNRLKVWNYFINFLWSGYLFIIRQVWNVHLHVINFKNSKFDTTFVFLKRANFVLVSFLLFVFSMKILFSKKLKNQILIEIWKWKKSAKTKFERLKKIHFILFFCCWNE